EPVRVPVALLEDQECDVGGAGGQERCNEEAVVVEVDEDGGAKDDPVGGLRGDVMDRGTAQDMEDDADGDERHTDSAGYVRCVEGWFDEVSLDPAGGSAQAEPVHEVHDVLMCLDLWLCLPVVDAARSEESGVDGGEGVGRDRE